MPLSDEQLKRLCLVAAKADLAEIGHYASDEAESIWGTYVPIVPAVAEAAVTDVLDRIDDAMDELAYAARWEHKDQCAVEIWVDAINLVRSFYPTPAPPDAAASMQRVLEAADAMRKTVSGMSGSLPEDVAEVIDRVTEDYDAAVSALRAREGQG